MDNNFYINTIWVHNGVFHSDDVSAVALAQMAFSNCKYRRVNKLPEGFDTESAAGEIAVDIGGGRFDHHQVDVPKRDDGRTHCGVTRLWSEFGKELTKNIIKNLTYAELSDGEAEKMSNAFDKEVLSTVAAVDNGEIHITDREFDFPAMVKNFNPNWDENIAPNKAFERAVNFTKTVFTSIFMRLYSGIKAENIIRNSIDNVPPEKREIIVLEAYMPWFSLTKYPEPKMVIYPTKDGLWNVQPIEDSNNRKRRAEFPQEWLGYNANSGAEEPVKGLKFCHRNGFLAAFDTKEAAKDAARIIVPENSN